MKPAGYRTYWDTALDYLRVFYECLIPATAAHWNSMSQDLRAGKRAEVDFLTGRIATCGGCLPAPVNRLVPHAIKRIEAVDLRRINEPQPLHLQLR